MFLTKEELKTNTLTEVIDIITRYDEDTVKEIIEENIAVITDYLGAMFDMEVVFSATGADRNRAVLKRVKAMVVYDIFCIRSHQYNQVVKDNYDDAMGWLEQLSSGKINSTLPPKLEGDPPAVNSYLKLGSRKSYQNGW